MIGRRWCLCTISFLEASVLENLDFMCCPGSGLCCSYNDFDHCTRSFVFSSSYFYCRFVASVMSLGNFVVVEARCNQYLGDINIFSLLKKLEKLFTK
jgi:hypothetical protein